MRKKLICCLVFFIAIFAFAKQKEEKKEGEKVLKFKEFMVVTAEKVSLSSYDVASSVSCVNIEEIKELDLKCAKETLNLIPSFYVPNYNNYGEASGVFLRGSSTDRSLFLLDGLPLNNTGFYLFPLEIIPAFFLKKVEVVEGPQSILWGSDALGGVVNFILDDEPVSQEVFLSIGSYSTLESYAKLGFKSTNLKLKGGYYRISTDGIVENDSYTNDALYLTSRWTPSRKIDVGINILKGKQEYFIPFVFRGIPARNRKGKDRVLFISIPFKVNFSQFRIELDPYVYEKEYIFTHPEDPWGITYSLTKSQAEGLRGELFYSFSKSFLVLVGVDFRKERVNAENNFGIQLKDVELSRGAFYLNLLYAISGRLTLSAGARYERSSRFGAQLLPKFSLSFWPLKDRIKLRFNYGEGFRLPKALEFAGYWGNPDLSPEKSEGWELGTDVFPFKGLRLYGFYFRTLYNDMIIYDFTSWKFANVGRAITTGFSAGGSFSCQKLTFTGSVSYLHARDEIKEEELLRRPHWMAKASVRAELPYDSLLNLYFLYVGKRKDFDDLLFKNVDNPGYFLINAVLTVPVYKNLKIVLKAHNLLDKEYQDIYGYPSPGRNLYAGLRINF